MVVLQLRVRKVVPGACVSIQQCRRLDGLFSVLASFTFKCVVSFTKSVLVELKELPESVYRKVSFGILFFVDDRRGQGLLVRLALEDLLFDRSR